MERKRKLYIAIGCCIALIALVVAVIVQTPDTTKTSYPPLTDVVTLYNQAVETLNEQESIGATISYVKETTIGGEVFRENAQQQVVYQNLRSEAFSGIVEESLTTGTHTVKISELYTNGQCYLTVAGIPFQCQITQQDYLARYTPITPIDIANYNKVTGIERNQEKIITFQDATAPETWAIPNTCTLQYAEGTAYLDNNNQLTKSIYTITYATDRAFVKLSVSVQLQSVSAQAIEPPADANNYTSIAYLDGPRMLEIASGHLMDCGNISAYYLEKIHCQLFGDLRTTEISLDTNHTNGWYAQVDTTVSVENSGKTGSLSTKKQKEIFQNGNYSVWINDAASAETHEVSKDAMSNYCRDILVNTVILPEHILGVSVIETSNTLEIQFQTTDAFADLLKSEALTALYQNAAILQDKEYKTDTLYCYLHIDKTTLLPIASGFQLTGNYQVDNLIYPLIYSADQTYQLYEAE